MRVAPDLESLLRDVDTLILLPDNPRRGDIDLLADSLQRFGQRKPIVADAGGIVTAGNHTLQAAMQLGWEQIAVTSDEDLDPAERAAYALADNHLSDLATYDNEALVEALTAAQDGGYLEAAGYAGPDTEAFLAAAAAGQHIDFGDRWIDNPGDERYTPAWLFEAMGVTFDRDLAAPADGISWLPANEWYSQEDDALTKDWSDEFVWCNPPFSLASAFGQKWLSEVTEGVWLGPISHGDYVHDLMRGSDIVWIPRDVEFVSGTTGASEGIWFPFFLAGYGMRGGDALRNLVADGAIRGTGLSPIR